MRRLIWTSAIVAIGSLATAADAFASGFAVRENCTAGVATISAGAGSLADDPCTVFNNPAGMTRLEGTQLELGITPVFITANFHGSLAGPTPAGVNNNNGGNGARPVEVPDLYAVTHITPDLAAGLAITAPFGDAAKYNDQWIGRYNVVEAEALSVDINPNIAYKINDKLSVAAGISGQYLRFTLSTAVNQSFLPVGTTSDALGIFRGDNWAFGYNFGLLWQPLPDTRMGLTYRSKIDHRLSGTFTFNNLNPLLAAGGLAGGHTEAVIAVPATTGLSVTHELSPRWTIASDLQWTQWSTFKSVTLVGPPAGGTFNESYKDSWFVSLGAIYHPEGAWSNWTFRGGVGWDQSPVQNAFRDPAVPDQDRYMAGAGFGYKLSERTSFDFAYAHYFATHATETGSANATAAPLAAFGGPTNSFSGSYQLSIDFVSAAVKFKF